MTGRSKSKGVYFRDGTAYIRYQDEHGADVRESTKQRSAKIAQDILAKRKTEVAMRVHFPTRAFDTVTFAELADYWWQAHGSKTRSQFEYLYPRVLEYLTDKRARDITPDVVDAFLDYLATERKLSASSVNHHRTIVNGIFNFAVKRGRFDRNPVAAVRQRPEPPGRDRIVSPAEFRKLWDKAKGDGEMRAFLALAGTTTMRKGEILSLRWDRVHHGGCAIRDVGPHEDGTSAPRADSPVASSRRSRRCPRTGRRTICSLHIRLRDARNRSDPIAGTSASSSARWRKRPACRTSGSTICATLARRS